MEESKKPHTNKTWTPTTILRRIGLDCASGALAAFTVAPIILTVDKAVVENSSGKSTIAKSVASSVKSLAFSPLKYIMRKEFIWIYFVYGSTYMCANSIDSMCKITGTDDVIPKLIGVTAVNMTASILKDRAFAYYFGKSGVGKVTKASMFIWFVRDILTMAGAFVLPSRLAKVFEENGVKRGIAEKTSQFICPVGFQFVLTPIHLLGYDIYNYPQRKMGDRMGGILKLYPSTTFIRMVRMGGAYGIGGVNNKSFRDRFISAYEGENWDRDY